MLVPAVTSLRVVERRLRDDILAWLAAEGFKVKTGATVTLLDAVLVSLKVTDKAVPPKPRELLVSRELGARQLSPIAKAGMAMIGAESRAGVDLTPRLTRSYYRAAFNDLLFATDDVQHLHLGPTNAGRKGQSGSTQETLFAIIEDNAIYCLDIDDHIPAFQNRDFSSIVGANWPHLLGEPLRVVRTSTAGLTERERAGLRGARANVLVDFGGQAYFPRGRGVTSSGVRGNLVISADRIRYELGKSHAWVIENAADLATRLSKENAVAVPVLNLWARKSETGSFAFFESETRSTILPDTRSI